MTLISNVKTMREESSKFVTISKFMNFIITQISGLQSKNRQTLLKIARNFKSLWIQEMLKNPNKSKNYSRVHISSDTAFLKILKKPSIVQE